MILAIGFSVRYYLVILCIILIGFSQCLWLLLSDSGAIKFAKPHDALHSSFRALFSVDFEDLSTNWAHAVMILFTVLVVVMLMNILIAIMGDKFDGIKDSGYYSYLLCLLLLT